MELHVSANDTAMIIICCNSIVWTRPHITERVPQRGLRVTQVICGRVHTMLLQQMIIIAVSLAETCSSVQHYALKTQSCVMRRLQLRCDCDSTSSDSRSAVESKTLSYVWPPNFLQQCWKLRAQCERGFK